MNKTGDISRSCWNDLLASRPDIFQQGQIRCGLVNQSGDLDTEEELYKFIIELVGKEEVFCLSDGFLFLSEEKAKTTAEKARPNFPGIEIDCFRKVVPPVQDNGFMLETESRSQLEDIEYILSQKEFDKTTFGSAKITKWKGAYRVVYPDCTSDISGIKTAAQSKSFKGKPILVKDICHTDCIRVSNLPSDAKVADVLKAVNSVERCRITKIVMPQTKEAFVYFSDYKDAEYMVGKLNESTLKSVGELVWGANVNFKLYFHKSTARQPTIESTQNDVKDSEKLTHEPEVLENETQNKIDPTSRSLPASPELAHKQSDNSSASTFELQVTSNPDVLELIFKSKRLHGNLISTFKSVTPELMKKIRNKTEFFYTVKITVPRKQENYAIDGIVFENKCLKKMQDFLSKFVTKSEKFDFDRLSDVRFEKQWDQKAEQVISFYRSDDSLVEVFVRWDDGEKGKVTVSGLETDVDPFLEKLKKETGGRTAGTSTESLSPHRNGSHSSTHSIKLKQIVARWFSEIAENDETCRNVLSNVKISMSADGSGILVVGQDQECIRAKHLVEEMAPQLVISKKQLDSEEDLRFLKSKSGKRIVEQVEKNGTCVVIIKDKSSSPLPQVQTTKRPEPGHVLSTRKLKDHDVIVRVVKVDITKMTCDAIVNTSNTQLELRQGGVSGSILRSGGFNIQREMNDIRQRRGYLPAGEAVTTGAGDLPPRKIIHVVGPTWYGHSRGNDPERCVMKCVESILREADAYRLSSVAIPAISCGVFGGDVTVCTGLIVDAILEYFATKFDSFVKRIDLVEYGDEYTLYYFMEALEKFSTDCTETTPQLTPAWSEDRPRNEIRIGNVTLLVKESDITMETCDAIVNPTNAEFQLNASQVGRSILGRGRSGKIQKECDVFRKKQSFPDFLLTSSGNLNCDNIFHLPVPQRLNHFQDVLLHLFRDADRRKMKTVAMPAIGTGLKVFTITTVVNSIKAAIKQFTADNPRNLREIRLVIYNASLMPECKEALSDDSNVRDHDRFNTKQGSEGRIDNGCVLLCAKERGLVDEAWMALQRGMEFHSDNDDISVSGNSITVSYNEARSRNVEIYELEKRLGVLIEFKSTRDTTVITAQGKKAEEALRSIKKILSSNRTRSTRRSPPNVENQRPGTSQNPHRPTQRYYAIPPTKRPGSAEERPHGSYQYYEDYGQSSERYDNYPGTSASSRNDSPPYKRENGGSYDFNERRQKLAQDEEEVKRRKQKDETELMQTRMEQSKKWNKNKKQEMKQNPGTHINKNRQATYIGPGWNHWKEMETDQWALVELHKDSPDYKNVVGKFRKGSTYIKTVVKVEELKNPALYQKFAQAIKSIWKTVEMFHGVKSEERSIFICQNGWNSDIEARNSRIHFRGTTFHTNPVLDVARADSHKLRRMFLAEVINDGKNKSTGNKTEVFNNSNAYPKYLLTFKAY